MLFAVFFSQEDITDNYFLSADEIHRKIMCLWTLGKVTKYCAFIHFISLDLWVWTREILLNWKPHDARWTPWSNMLRCFLNKSSSKHNHFVKCFCVGLNVVCACFPLVIRSENKMWHYQGGGEWNEPTLFYKGVIWTLHFSLRQK